MGSQGGSAPVTVIAGELAWDHRADVVVVGTGIAGCSTAFNTLERGATVLMLEKGETTGGTSAKAGAGILVPNNRFLRKLGQDDPREDFIRFLARVGRPLLYNADGEFFGLPEWEYRLIETWYDNAPAAFDHMEAAGALLFEHDAGFATYNEVAEDKRRTGRVVQSVDDDGNAVNGRPVIDRLVSRIQGLGGEVLTRHRVDGVFLNPEREVVGVRADHEGRRVLVRANRAVVFASGGFTHSERYTREYLNGMYVGGCAARTNEGDLIPIAKALGIPLFHMHSAWGAPLLFEQALAEDPALIANFSFKGDSGLSVNPSLQVLDGTDTPVPGLYGVGNCMASPSGQAYWSGGTTWGPYITFGFVAAKMIAAEPVKPAGVTAPA
jgi:choline dehydrogenase-like flavoprotein